MVCGLVAIIGRPNVGKSTLFNRLTRAKAAIVSDRPGVTRDRLYGRAFYDASHTEGFLLVDTGGYETDSFKFQPFAQNLVWKQTAIAITESDLVLLVVDGKHGLHQHDQELVAFLKKENKRFLLVVNKIDGKEREPDAWDFLPLGTQDLIPMSAKHGRGNDQLLERIRTELHPSTQQTLRATSHRQAYEGRKIALVGRQNAGKSSILNRLLGEERSIVSDYAGTTIDSVDSVFLYNKQPYILVDTAGIRRRSRITEEVEVQSVFSSLRALEEADLIFYVIDAQAGLTDQDSRLLNLAYDRFKPVLVIVNKWDLIEDKRTNTSRDYARDLSNRIPPFPIMFVSCKTNQRIHSILGKMEVLLGEYGKRVNTAQVNACLQRHINAYVHPVVGLKRVKFFFATQQDTCPPLFIISCNTAKTVLPAYQRYLLKNLKKDLGFDNVPVKLVFRNKNERRDAAEGETGEEDKRFDPTKTPPQSKQSKGKSTPNAKGKGPNRGHSDSKAPIPRPRADRKRNDRHAD